MEGDLGQTIAVSDSSGHPQVSIMPSVLSRAPLLEM